MWSKLTVSAVDFALNLVITLISTSGLLWVAGASEAPHTSRTADELQRQLTEQSEQNEDLRHRAQETLSEANRLKRDFGQLQESEQLDLQSEPGRLADVLNQARNEKARIEQELRSFLPELDNLRREKLKTERDRREYAAIEKLLAERLRGQAAVREEIAEIQRRTIPGPAVRISLPPLYSEDEREPVYVMLSQGTVTPVRPPYYSSTQNGQDSEQTLARWGDSVDRALSPGSDFVRFLDGIDQTRQYVLLLVTSDSFETFRTVRKYLKWRGISLGWEPNPSTTVRFTSNSPQAAALASAISNRVQAVYDLCPKYNALSSRVSKEAQNMRADFRRCASGKGMYPRSLALLLPALAALWTAISSAAIPQTYYTDARAEQESMIPVKSDLYIAASGIHSSADSGDSKLVELVESRSIVPPLVVRIDIAGWKREGHDFRDPKTYDEIRNLASAQSQRAMRLGRDIVFDVSPDLKLYTPWGRNASDYLGDRKLWDRETGFQANVIGAVSRGYQTVNSGGNTHFLGHSAAVYSFAQTTVHFDTAELYEGRVGRDQITPRIRDLIEHGASVFLFTGNWDAPSWANVATKSVAFQLAKETGATALYDRLPLIHDIRLTPSKYDVYSPKLGLQANVQLDPAKMYASTDNTFRSSDRTPYAAGANNIRGVLLSCTAQFVGANGRPAAVNVDLTGNNFSLVVDGKNARIAPESYRKFITALWCVYYSDQDPGISIDPIAPNIEKHLVRYIGRVINTDLGRVMRDADYLMKKWAVGTEKPDYPGFQSVDALMARIGRTRAGVSRRFWFVPEDMSFTRADDLLLFASGRMRVKTEYVDQAANRGAAPSDEAFAGFFTEHYSGLAEKYPVYKELFEYAQLVSLAKYLKQQGVPLHWFLVANKHLVLTEDSPGTVDQLAKGSEYFSNMTLMGGVDLKTEGHYVYDQQAVAAIRQAMAQMPAMAAGRTDPGGSDTVVRRVPRQFSFDKGSQSYTVLPQHTLTSGKDFSGNRYQTDFALRQDGDHPGLELVRYYSPRNRAGGDFGQGWRLVIPYQVAAADDDTLEFRGAAIPRRMKVTNLFTGDEEVMSFSEDCHQGLAGYVPEKVKASQVIGLFLFTNATFRLVDKLGNEFHFDHEGRLTEMAFSPRRADRLYVDYVNGATDAFDQKPYAVETASSETVPFPGGAIPKQFKVTDLVHGRSEQFTFSADKKEIVGYVPDDEKASRFEFIAVLRNRGLQMLDKHGNEVVFAPDGKFNKVLPSREHPLVCSVAMGGRRAAFRYTIDGAGRILIGSATLAEDKPDAPPIQLVRYVHDAEGRLCRIEHSSSAAVGQTRPRERSVVLARK